MNKELVKALVTLYMFREELGTLLDKTDTPMDNAVFNAFMSYVGGVVPPDIKAAIDNNFQEVNP